MNERSEHTNWIKILLNFFKLFLQRLHHAFLRRFATFQIFAHHFLCGFWGHFFKPHTVRIDHDYRAVVAKVIAMRFREMHFLVQILFLEFVPQRMIYLVCAMFSAR